MKEELQVLLHNHTYDLVRSAPSQNVIRCKWVYCINQKGDGSIDKYKARLFAKGFIQWKGVDCIETFNPVTKLVTIGTIISIVVPLHWPIWQLDIRYAFLHGHLNKEIYIQQPLGFTNPLDHIMCFVCIISCMD